MKSQEIVDRSHQLDGEPARLSAFYGAWATTYEDDARNMGYEGPQRTAAFLSRLAPRFVPDLATALALDAGCGTGLVGPALRQVGVTTLDGVDLNHEMVTQAAATGAYRHLTSGTDLNLGLPEFAPDAYDLTVSCGVFTTGHVQPRALDGLLRVTRPGGLVLLTTSARYLRDTTFRDHLAELTGRGRARVVECLPDHPYLTRETAHYWALTPTGRS